MFAGKVIGRGGNIITDILEKSRVNNVKVVGDEEARHRNIDPATNVSNCTCDRYRTLTVDTMCGYV